MREIPEDIRATVEDLFEDSLMRPFRNDEVKRLVARAILAERERYQWQPIETAQHGTRAEPCSRPMEVSAMRELPRDLVTILRTEARNQRTPPIDYVIAEDGGRMVHRPDPDIAMAELLEEAASALEAQAAELLDVKAERDEHKRLKNALVLKACPAMDSADDLVEALRRYGFPVSDAAETALMEGGSREAQALQKAAKAFIAGRRALIDQPTAALGAQTPPEGAEAQGWRDMASAPRDGSMVLVASSRVYPAVHPARWRSTDADASSFQYWDAWQHWFQDDDLLGWQPLPTPPVNQSEGADRG